jgi:putative redox protein
MLTTATWNSHLHFTATSDNGHSVPIDTTTEGGSLNQGMNPKQMLLGSLCVCSGMDVVSILEKMQVPFSHLTITAQAEQTTEHPKVFKDIAMVYQLKVATEFAAKVERAVELSHTKYCGISAMLSKHCAITYSIQIT